MIKRIRPQVLTAMVLLTAIGVYALSQEAEQITAICATGIVGAVTKLIESS